MHRLPGGSRIAFRILTVRREVGRRREPRRGFHVMATWCQSPSGEDNAYLLPGNRLGSLVDVVIDNYRDHRISACHRMIGKKDDRLSPSRKLDRTANHALAWQLLALPGSVVLQRLTLQAHPDPVALTGGGPLCRSKRIWVGEPVVSRAAQRM